LDSTVTVVHWNRVATGQDDHQQAHRVFHAALPVLPVLDVSSSTRSAKSPPGEFLWRVLAEHNSAVIASIR
jgi:hypothetical protein